METLYHQCSSLHTSIPLAPEIERLRRAAGLQAADEAVKTMSPVTNTRRRPSRSASAPAVRRNAASVSEYALTTHCRS